MSSDKWFVVAVVAFMVVLASVVMMVRNARLNRRDDEAAARTQTAVLPEWRDGLPDQTGGSASPGETGRPDSGVLQVPDVPALASGESEAQLDEEWANTLAVFNEALHDEYAQLSGQRERVHPAEPCQEWCCWERRLEAQRAAWLELVRADVTVVAEWIVAGTPGRWVPSAAGWPSDDWRGEMIPA